MEKQESWVRIGISICDSSLYVLGVPSERALSTESLTPTYVWCIGYKALLRKKSIGSIGIDLLE